MYWTVWIISAIFITAYVKAKYNALDIDLTVPLEKQIQNKLVETKTAIQKELARKEQKEYETYLRLKEKFE